MLLALLVISLLAIFLWEAPRLVLEKMWWELTVFVGLWSFASFLAVAQFLGADLPNPTVLLNAIFMPK